MDCLASSTPESLGSHTHIFQVGRLVYSMTHNNYLTGCMPSIVLPCCANTPRTFLRAWEGVLLMFDWDPGKNAREGSVS